MKFKPMSDEELDNLLLLPEGTYQFQVMEAKDEISKSGNEMIKLKLRIDDGSHAPRFVFDYLLEAMKFKLRHFARATGLLEVYDRGELTAEDCLNKCGTVEIIVQNGTRKDDGGIYPPKNVVKDYITDPSKFDKVFHAGVETLYKKIEMPNDDIPF